MSAAPVGSPLPQPRLLLVFAHPDDEVLAFGARLERLAASRLLTVTDGTPRDGADARHHGFSSLDAYREARREELRCALHDAGLTEAILAPLASRSTFPVADQTAAHHLRDLTELVADQITAFKPDAVFTHPYEGGHPDHDACAFAVHTAVRLLSRSSQHAGETPPICETPFYHAGANGSMQTGAFLPHPRALAELVCPLSPGERISKERRLLCFRSQAETLSQFACEQERFRMAPQYDFSNPPHGGQLFYEQFPWGMTGARFVSLAEQAFREAAQRSTGIQPRMPTPDPSL